MPAFAHLPLLLKPEGNGKLSSVTATVWASRFSRWSGMTPSREMSLQATANQAICPKRSLISWLCWAGIRAMTRN